MITKLKLKIGSTNTWGIKMKTMIANQQLNCDVCGAQNCDEVYDAPSGGRWGNFCPKCAAQYIDLNGMGTHLKRPEAEPGWRDQFPEFAALIDAAKNLVDEYGQTYIDALEDSWALYGKEGLVHQISYITSNFKPDKGAVSSGMDVATGVNVKVQLELMKKQGLR